MEKWGWKKCGGCVGWYGVVILLSVCGVCFEDDMLCVVVGVILCDVLCLVKLFGE